MAVDLNLKILKAMSDYKLYPQGTKVKIISTGEEGEAFETALGTISVFIDDEEKCSYYSYHEIEFINP